VPSSLCRIGPPLAPYRSTASPDALFPPASVHRPSGPPRDTNATREERDKGGRSRPAKPRPRGSIRRSFNPLGASNPPQNAPCEAPEQWAAGQALRPPRLSRQSTSDLRAVAPTANRVSPKTLSVVSLAGVTRRSRLPGFLRPQGGSTCEHKLRPAPPSTEIGGWFSRSCRSFRVPSDRLDPLADSLRPVATRRPRGQPCPASRSARHPQPCRP